MCACIYTVSTVCVASTLLSREYSQRFESSQIGQSEGGRGCMVVGAEPAAERLAFEAVGAW